MDVHTKSNLKKPNYVHLLFCASLNEKHIQVSGLIWTVYNWLTNYDLAVDVKQMHHQLQPKNNTV